MWMGAGLQLFEMKNLLKRKLKAGKNSIGTWISIGHPDVTEILSGVGFDWLLFDMEHGSLTMESVERMMQSMNGNPAAPLVRVASKDPVLIGQALDAGAHGVMAPLVNTPQDAQKVVAACKYPPKGSRGVGPRRATQYGRSFSEYLRTANDEILIVAQIETPEAVRNIDAILSVRGIDVAAIGTGDLSMAMGCFADRKRKDFRQAIGKVQRACERHGVVPGMAYVSKPEQARESIRAGFRFIGVSEDYEFLIHAAANTLQQIQ